MSLHAGLSDDDCTDADQEWGRRRRVLPHTEVHVWSVELDPPPRSQERLARVLSADEHQRANAFVFPADRHIFVAARGILRMLIGAYQDCAPDAIRFRYGLHGKPMLRRPAHALPLEFNAAHSGGLALFAFTRGHPVGVDLEALRPLGDIARIAHLCCSPRERETLNALPPETRNEAFLRLWTAKEACAKALGVGLAYDPKRIEVAFTPSGTPTLWAPGGDPAATARWALRPLSAAPRHVATLALPDRGLRVRRLSLANACDQLDFADDSATSAGTGKRTPG